VIGVEIEAAGATVSIPVGVIRGVCDYGDEHKNKEWQPYAAAMAAAYGKAILAQIGPRNPRYHNQDRRKDAQLLEVQAADVFPGTHPALPHVYAGVKRRDEEREASCSIEPSLGFSSNAQGSLIATASTSQGSSSLLAIGMEDNPNTARAPVPWDNEEYSNYCDERRRGSDVSLQGSIITENPGDDIESLSSQRTASIARSRTDATKFTQLEWKAIYAIADCFAGTDELGSLCKLALGRMHEERFTTNLGRALKSYSMQLKFAAVTEKHRQVARFFSSKTKRTKIAQKIVEIFLRDKSLDDQDLVVHNRVH
jgi:hypothetical protein